MSDDKKMEKLNELYLLAVKIEDVYACLSVLEMMSKVGEPDCLEGDRNEKQISK